MSGFGVTLLITHPSLPTTHLSVRRDAHPPEPPLVLLSSPPFMMHCSHQAEQSLLVSSMPLWDWGIRWDPAEHVSKGKVSLPARAPSSFPVAGPCVTTCPMATSLGCPSRALALCGAVWVSLCPCSALCCGVERRHWLGKGAWSDGLPGRLHQEDCGTAQGWAELLQDQECA